VAPSEFGAPARHAPRPARAPPLLLALALALLPAIWVLQPHPVRAQGLNPLGASSDSRPIDITADSGIEWQQDKQVYIARGNAVATRGTSEVHADTLTAHYRPSKDKSAQGGNEVYRLDADGHVLIKGPNQTVVGDQAIYDVDQQIGVITGKHLRLTTPTDTVTARDSLEWYDQQQIAVARGDALAIRADRRIRADVLTAHFVKDKDSANAGAAAGAKPGGGKPAAGKPGVVAAEKSVATGSAAPSAKSAAGKATSTKPPKPGPAGAAADPSEGNSKISRVDAQGHVVVVTTTDIGRGDYGVYNADTGIVTLLGNVTITRGQDTVRGQYAVVDLNTNVSRIMTVAAKPGAPAPRVEGLFYRQDTTANSAVKTGAPGAAKSGIPGSTAKSRAKPAIGAPKS
jgi:lipopolysaccharide export system protein LptA